MDALPEWFGKRLRELRAAAGLTQTQLAERAGLSLKGVAQWERGEREPGWSSILAICKALGVGCETFTQPPAGREPAKTVKPARPMAAKPRRPRGRPRKEK
jgi:transcriptional regulator with XRE-family HTH domain